MTSPLWAPTMDHPYGVTCALAVALKFAPYHFGELGLANLAWRTSDHRSGATHLKQEIPLTLKEVTVSVRTIARLQNPCNSLI